MTEPEFEPRLPSRYEDLDEEFKGRLRPNRDLIEVVKRALASMRVNGGVRFIPIYGESGSGKSSATIQIGTHLPSCEVRVLSAKALEDSETLQAEISDNPYKPTGQPLIAVIDQFEETASEKAGIPSNFVEKVALLDRSHRGRPIIFVWLTTSREFQQQLSQATSRNTRILVSNDFEVQGPSRQEWPEIISETFSFHNHGKDLADFQVLDQDVEQLAETAQTLGTAIGSVGERLAAFIAHPIDLSEFQVVMLWPVTDGLRIETLNRFASPRQGYRLNWSAFVNQLNPRDRGELPLSELNKARLYFDVRLVPIAAADIQKICGSFGNPAFKLSTSYLNQFASTHFFTMMSKPDREATFVTLRERDSIRRKEAETWYGTVTGKPTEIGEAIAHALRKKGLDAGHERTFDAGFKRVRADVWVQRDTSPKTSIVEIKAFSPSHTRPSAIADAIRVTLTRHAQFAGFLRRS